jgi:ABC-type amino acid transport substrate-binding protein
MTHQERKVKMSQEDLYQLDQNDLPDEEAEEEKKKKSVWPWVLGILTVLLISAVLLLVLSPQPVEDDSWERVKLSGVLRVATSADYPPFSFYNQDLVIDGFDPALIREIGTRLGVRVEITDYAFQSLNTVLQLDQADVVIAAVSVSPERDAVVDFSNVYFVSDDGVLARADSGLAPITNIMQFAGLSVGVQRGSVYEKWARDILVASTLISEDRLFVYAKPEHAVADLKANRLHVVILDRQPAIQYLSDPDLVLAGQKLHQQRLAIVLPDGTQALQTVINQALLELQNEGKISELAQRYLGLRPEDIIPPPTCLDSMTFVRNLNLDDNNLTVFPEFESGVSFQRGWQIKNTGTCTWDNTYVARFVRGNHPAAQMNGQPTAISGTVEPGQTYDLFVDLVAPQQPGQYVGYWQMHDPEGVPFGQTIWVAIRVPGTPPEPTETVEPQPPTPTPTLTPTPTAIATEMPTPEPTETETPPEPTEAPGSDLVDVVWVLDAYLLDDDDDELTQVIDNVEVLMSFDGTDKVTGNTGCNNFSGRYVTNGKAIVIEDILITSLICDQIEGLMDQEDLFIERLERVAYYRIVLNGQNNEILEMFITVIEDGQEVEKVLLMFYDQQDGPPRR